MNLMQDPPTTTQARRILIVEDEAVIAMDMAQHLRDFGFDVVGVAASGERALELMARAQPDLVMMDIVIKGPHDGIETARLMREQHDVPVVFLTAYADAATLERAKQASPHGYLLKPFRPQDLRTMIEVTLHRQSLERRVRESEHWLLRTLQCLGDGVIATDPAGCIRFLNGVAETLVGCRADAARGRSVAEVIALQPEDGGDALPELLARALRSPAQLPLQRGLLHGEGEPRLYVDAGAAAIRDDDGQALGGVLVLRDVTQRRLDEIELSRHRDHLETLVRERTAELDLAREAAERASRARLDFLSTVSHELRTPLNAVLGFGQLLAMETLTPRQQGFVRQVGDAGQHLMRVIDDLLDLAKIDAGRMSVRREAVPVGEVLEHTSGMVASIAAAAGVSLEIEPVPASHVVAADTTRLRQVLFNLLSNAIKYNRPHGHVRVGSLELPDGRLRIVVADTGIGIAPALQERLFRAFERLDAEGGRVGGTGLGLAFSKRVTALMQGELGVQSTPGEGSTFWVDLPRWDGDRLSDAQPTA